MKPTIYITHLLNDFSGSTLVLKNAINILSFEYNIVLLTSRTNGFLTNLNVKYIDNKYKRYNNSFLILFSLLYSQLVTFAYIFFASWKKYKIIVNTMLPFGAQFACFITRRQSITYIHETSINKKLKIFLRLLIELGSKKIIFVSNFLKQEEEFKNKKSIVLYNILVSEHKEISKNNTFVVSMLCSLKKYKGVLEFIKIAENLILLDSTIKFVLVLNTNIEEYEDFFADIQIPANVEIFQNIVNCDEIYRKSSLVLNLSRIEEWQETFGMTILESFAYGVPVIAPPVGGPLEIVDDGSNGYLIDSRKIHEIIKKIRELNNSKELWEEMSRSAHIKSKNFNYEDYKRELLKIAKEA